MKVKRWRVGIALAAALTVALSLALWPRPTPPNGSGPWLVPIHPDASSRPSLDQLIERYSTEDSPCALPSAERVVRWHGLRFAPDPTTAPQRPLPPAVEMALRSLGTKVALSRSAHAGRPWALLLPEVHEHEESEEYVLRLARSAARALEVPEVKVFVEAWSQEVRVDHGGSPSLSFSGLETVSAYPWSRAAWGLLDLVRATQGRSDPITVEVARRALLGQQPAARLRVGQHRSPEAVERALALYARAWNALCDRFAPQTSTRARLPVAADYFQHARWVELSQEAELILPSDPAAYRPGSPLHTAALTLAAVTSRLRTTEFALRVLETTEPPDDALALLQVGANHVFPLVDLLERAGWGWAILLSPSSGKWMHREDDWRCPVPSLPRPLRTGLGYYRLPASPAVRAGLSLSEVVALPSSPPG